MGRAYIRSFIAAAWGQDVADTTRKRKGGNLTQVVPISQP